MLRSCPFSGYLMNLLANLQLRREYFGDSRVNPHFSMRGSGLLTTMIESFCINCHLEIISSLGQSDLPSVKRNYVREHWNMPHLNSSGWHQIKASEYFLEISELMSNNKYQGHEVALNCLNCSAFALSVI